MTTIFSGMNSALRALLAQQHVQLVISNNVANANTPGYSRQEAVLASGYTYTRAAFNRPETALQLGMGAAVVAIRRFNLGFIDDRIRNETASFASWSQRETIMNQVEAMLPESNSSGISEQLNNFWAAWQNLSGDPSSTANRSAVAQSADSLSTMIHNRYVALGTTRRDEDAHLVSMVGDVNVKASAVARLNTLIVQAVGAGDQPNDLLDQRDVLLNDLAELAGATVNFNPNGDSLVSIGGHILVAGGETRGLSTVLDSANPGMSKVVWADGDANITSGRMAGSIQARDVDIVARMTALDTLASGLINQVNAVHQNAYGLPPGNVTNLDFFTGTGAQDIGVNTVISGDLSQLGAAAAANAPGDGSQARVIAQLASALTMSGSSRTFNGFWSDTIAQIGLDLRRATNEATSHKLVQDAMSDQKQSESSVSLDEEAARLVESQRAYEAAARVLTAFDEMADTIINGMGRVGR
jgi:flagellar hook-associated protein 1 FlgK